MNKEATLAKHSDKVQNFRRMHFHRFMDQKMKVSTQHIIFMKIIGLNFVHHFNKDIGNGFLLFFIDKENGSSANFEELGILKISQTVSVMHKMICKKQKKPF
jgi:hypothetical protein